MQTRLVAAAGVVVLGAAVIWSCGLATPDAFDIPLPFSSARWKASPRDEKARCSMVGDLTGRVGLVGRSENEVVKLLGQPDERSNSSTSAYLLCPSFADVYILELFWARGRVASARVRDT